MPRVPIIIAHLRLHDTLESYIICAFARGTKIAQDCTRAFTWCSICVDSNIIQLYDAKLAS